MCVKNIYNEGSRNDGKGFLPILTAVPTYFGCFNRRIGWIHLPETCPKTHTR